MSLAGAPVLWSEAFQAPASASAQAPSSASAASTAGFVELSPMHAMEPAELHDALAADPAVSRVVYNSTKTSEGNPGNHYMEQSLLAFAWRPKDPRKPDKGMVITWAVPVQANTAPGAASASGSSVPAEQVAPPAANSRSSPPALGGGCSWTPGMQADLAQPGWRAP